MTQTANSIFTIGYAALAIERFIELLRLYCITILADVRSQPYSRYSPEYSRDPLKVLLEKSGIRYVFMGKELGARRDEPECYEDSKARYDLIVKTPAFREGIARLKRGALKYRIALLCAEKDPITCHRSILVSRELSREGVNVQHIRHDCSLESQQQLEQRLLKLHERDQVDLFDNKSTRLNYVYTQQADYIAFVREGEE